jgi:hypothetical protein
MDPGFISGRQRQGNERTASVPLDKRIPFSLSLDHYKKLLDPNCSTDTLH